MGMDRADGCQRAPLDRLRDRVAALSDVRRESVIGWEAFTRLWKKPA